MDRAPCLEVVPFSVTLVLEAEEASGAEPVVEAEAGAGAGEEGLEALADALNRTLAAARTHLQVQVVSRAMEEVRGGGSRRMRVVLRGRLPASPPAFLARDWADDLDLSPEALANLFIELAATLVGLSWGVYSMWLAG
ncbi:hypothetical protein R5R35_003102 [Gryllus longicercus]|uniref:Uncharacterized protein n=1 Tax=Gryllus longicercus TaxID=2509291 RepID=A0AAN9Z1H6_9ORTH